MKSIVNFVSRYITNVPAQVQRAWIPVVLLLIVFIGVCFAGIPKLQFDFTIERWLEQDDQAFVAYNQFHDQFGSEDGVVVVYKPKDGDVFSHDSLVAVQGIREDLINYWNDLGEGTESALDHVVKVDTLANAFVLSVEDDILLSTSLVGSDVPTSSIELEKIREKALSQRDFPLKYFSTDMKYGAIYIETNFGAIPLDEDENLSTNAANMDMTMETMSFEVEVTEEDENSMPRFKPTDMADYVALNAEITRILTKPEYAEHLEYYKVGNTIDSENQVKMGEEMGLLYMAALFVMLVLLFLLFRSFSGVIWPFVIIVLTSITTIGLAGWMGLSASPFIVLTILLILTIGMADAVHITSGYLFFRNKGYNFQEAMRATYEKAGIACLLTSVTTIVGLLSLCFTDIVPVRYFAIMSATGVAVAFLFTLYLLPILLKFWSPIAKNSGEKINIVSRFIDKVTPNIVPYIQKQLDGVIPLVLKSPILVVIPFIVIFAVCVYGAMQVKVDYSVLDQYTEDSNFYQSIKLMDEKMAGSSRISLYLDVKEDNALQNPEVLRVIENMQETLETKYSDYVITTSSIVDVVKDAYQKQNEGREDKYVIPSTKKELSQTLFMFNTADPEERSRLVSERYSKANITVTLKTYGSERYRDVFVEMKKDIYSSLELIKQDYPDATISVTGIFAMGMKAADYLIVTILQSFGMALLVISLILLVIFSSVKAGFISLIPNLIPSFLALGILGLMGKPLDFYTMMLAPIIIGISVDDTIHFITQYRVEVMKDNDIIRALKSTVKECGQAVVFTSMILGLGFGIMSVATTPGFENLGKFGFLSVLSGLLCDLFLTPALIILFQLKFKKSESSSSIDTAGSSDAETVENLAN
ncbi:efflux RND transporter permease subunit [Teredinibacter sp. KSP-S5-2]|uniref:efflux RND transporter permease subunit n=1 Tax=Teredinibacter sp. KSP-S5-2 TaxID=3034506 RepID=UPI002934D73D|nr:MMPL family transporter [Teredinibacter sp. KSP-S5-2]WNO11557.1 MMPL family transporter [Teredinibacter sp. KSP-S5-2]